MGRKLTLVRARLSLMMFLEYFIWSAWGISIGTYASTTLRFDGNLMTWILSTTALGAIIAPLFVGLVADRLFATQRVLASLHLVGGVCLCLAAGVEPESFWPLMVLMTVNALCYMPTLALTNSLAFRNIPDSEKDFPIIRVWGTIGWVVAGLIVGIALGENRNYFFYLAGGSAILMGLYCLTLPHTPPTTAAEAMNDPLGLRALALLRERSFAVFVVSAFLVCVVLSFYWSGANLFLAETDRPAPTALQALGQFSEIFFMAAMPWFIGLLGLKRMLLAGILAWVVRYACFASLNFPLVLLGLLLHGVCYDFFFVAAYIYVDKRAPGDLRASAQSLITFIMLGIGMLVGMKLAGYVLDAYPPQLTIAATAESGQHFDKAPLPDWPATESYAGPWRYFDLVGTLRPLIYGPDRGIKGKSLARQLGSDHEDRAIIRQLEYLPPEVTIDKTTYAKADLIAAFTKADTDGDGTVTRTEWLAAKVHRWPQFWAWPLGLALLTAVFFGLGFRNAAEPKT
jgi:nucleoside transporter